MDEKANWKAFYKAEKELFEFINRNCQTRYQIEGCEPKYQEFHTKLGSIIEKPPRFIRYIGSISYGKSDFLSLRQEVSAKYKIAMAGKYKKDHCRFAQYFTNIQQINISVNDAYQSTTLNTTNEVIVKSSYLDKANEIGLCETYAQDTIELKKTGLTSAKVVYETLNSLGEMAISISVDPSEFFAFAQATKIQVRRNTGKQYIARIRAVGQSKSIRTNLGCIVVDESSATNIFESLPQAPRPHRLDARGLEISLPITTDFHFYRKL